MTDAPAVSVLMTVHNGERYLCKAIDSVLGQTLGAFELIVVDDLSTDRTPAILSAYVGRDPRVRVLHNETNLGPYPSANRGLELARAEVIARIDADDLCEPERLARQLAFLDRNPDCLLVGSGYRSIDARGRVRFVRHNPLDPATAAFVGRLRMPMVHPSFCFRRRRSDGTPVSYDSAIPIAGDYGLAAALAREGQVASLGDPLVSYRMHEANISSTKVERQRYFAHIVAMRAVENHYPPRIAHGLYALLDAFYRLSRPDSRQLATAAQGLDAALAHDFGSNPPSAVRERAAGILAEAFLSGVSGPAMLPAMVRHAPRHLIPLALRAARLRNWLSPSAGPD